MKRHLDKDTQRNWVCVMQLLGLNHVRRPKNYNVDIYADYVGTPSAWIICFWDMLNWFSHCRSFASFRDLLPQAVQGSSFTPFTGSGTRLGVTPSYDSWSWNLGRFSAFHSVALKHSRPSRPSWPSTHIMMCHDIHDMMTCHDVPARIGYVTRQCSRGLQGGWQALPFSMLKRGPTGLPLAACCDSASFCH
jgi:hypothetical protein